MSWRPLFDEATEAFRQGRHHDALQLCDRTAQQGEEARYHAAMLRGDVLLDMGDAAGALSSYESVADPDRHDPLLDCARGIAMFELGRLPEAENALRSCLRGRADIPEAYFALGLIAEIRGTGGDVECYRQARKLEPERFPAVPRVSPEEMDEALDGALAKLAAPERALLAGVELQVVDLPSMWDLQQPAFRLSPLSLAVLLPPGTALCDAPAPDVDKPTLYLFKRNLERAARDKERLLDEIAKTLAQEAQALQGLAVLEPKP